MKKLAAVLLLLLGCDTPKDAVKSVVYYRDTRTGICFASGMFSNMASDMSINTSSVFSYVPCEKVPATMIHDVD